MPSVSDLGRAAKQAHPGAYDDVPDADLGRAFKKAYPGSYDDFAEVTTAGTGRTGARLKGNTQESPLLTAATAAMIGGPILGEGAALLPFGKSAAESATPEGGLPEIGRVGRFISHIVPGGRAATRAYDALRELIPAADQPTVPRMPAPPVRFKPQDAPWPAPPVTFREPPAASKPWAPPLVTFRPVEETPEAPAPKPWPAPPVRFPKAGKAAGTGPAAPAPASTPAPAAAPPPVPSPQPAAGIPPIDVPFGQPVVTPPETLPSADWRFEDARDMARLLHQHGINPADMEEGQWQIAAPALKRNLGVPNARSSQMVQQEWNKLQPRGQ